jgi:predicted dehydrogenase
MRIGIVGAGNIVKWCLEALENTPLVHCEAICVLARDLDMAKQYQAAFSIPKIYTEFEQLLSDPEVDFIYLGIPNKFHFAYALNALQAGKHVISEKPFTSDHAEALQLANLAKDKKLFLFEAITTLYAPNVLLLKELLPKLGQLKLVQSNYSQFSSRYNAYLQGQVHPAFDPAMSGGSLYDINIYNIHLACCLFGVPDTLDYFCNKGFNGIDTSGVVIMQYPDFIAVCAGAKDSASPSQTIIQGVNGYLKLASSPNIARSVELVMQGESQTFNQHEFDNHMVYEMNAFHDMFARQAYDECYRHLDHSLSVMKLLTEARRKAEILFQEAI